MTTPLVAGRPAAVCDSVDADLPLIPPPPVTPLEAVAAQINEAHAAAQAYASKAVERALVAGDLLNGVKAQLKHGEFLPWCKTHCPDIGQRRLQEYMKVARDLPAEIRGAAYLSLRDALRLVADPDPEPVTGELLPAAAPATPDPADVIAEQQRQIEALTARINAEHRIAADLAKPDPVGMREIVATSFQNTVADDDDDAVAEIATGVAKNDPTTPIAAPAVSTADPRQLGYIGTATPVAERDSNDWHTPAKYIEAVRSVLGSIDLDPFSSALANETVKADRFLTVADDALGDAPWCVSPVTAFLNPPYGKGVIDAAVARFLTALPGLSSAIILVNNATETHWFHELLQACDVACFVNHRIAFVSPDNKQESGNTRGQVFLLLQSAYWAVQKNNQKTARERIRKFTEVFSDIGFVMGAAP